MEYNDIEKFLKRISFDEKMAFSSMHSTKLIELHFDNSSSKNKFLKSVYPWELETFILFSIKSDEWKNNELSNEDFTKIINAIRIKSDVFLSIKTNEYSLLEKIFIPSAANQFEWQRNIYMPLYRYNYYFNFSNDKINMREEFYNKFGCYYDDFSFIAYLIWVMLGGNAKNHNNILIETYQNLYEKYNAAINALTISREEYTDELDKITQDINYYVICFKPSYKYPFIKYHDKIYFPLPHLIIKASTSSLMYRLTEGNPRLNEKIGKEVYESYIFKLLNDTNMFDEVIEEKTYKNDKGEELRTLDVLTHRDNNIVLFDSKSFSPKIDLRILSDDAYQSDLSRLAQAYKQLYLHLTKYIDKEMSFFKEEITDKTNIFGIAIIKDEVFFDKEKIYKKAAELIGIELDSNEYIWLCKHITHISIDVLENLCFCQNDIVKLLLESFNNDTKNMIEISTPNEQQEFKNKNINDFIDEFTNSFVEKAKDFFNSNCFNNS